MALQKEEQRLALQTVEAQERAQRRLEAREAAAAAAAASDMEAREAAAAAAAASDLEASTQALPPLPLTTAYGRGDSTPMTPFPASPASAPPSPFCPPDDLPESIARDLRETGTNLDKHLEDFHQESNTPNPTPKADNDDDDLLPLPSSPAPPHRPSSPAPPHHPAAPLALLNDASFYEVPVTDAFSIRVGRLPAPVQAYLDKQRLKLTVDARLVPLDQESQQNFGDLSQMSAVSGGEASLTEADARSIAEDAVASFKRFSVKAGVAVLLLALLLSFDASCRVAARASIAAASAFLPRQLLLGSDAAFTIRSADDGMCFDGSVFRPCTAASLFFSSPAASSPRYQQLLSLQSPDMCLGGDKKGELGMRPCQTQRGATMDGTVFGYEGGILASRSKSGDELCVRRMDGNAGRVGRCGEIGYTPVIVAAALNDGLFSWIRFEDRWVGVDGLEEVGDSVDGERKRRELEKRGGASVGGGSGKASWRQRLFPRAPVPTSNDNLEHLDEISEEHM
ncbi:hypothetical protein TeGR_g358 [Tetraparma gracilis]|uniref:Uncharacterized protein n=1 Tax=Tetraparma gracilis TaxID=2962635 RepID=A0ABQ6MCU5_9STRA|nr:hypothetical protein TeGR_g358 [Tetraparma gracilis]